MHRDYFVSWEVCYHPKKDRGLCLDNMVSKIIALEAKWLWHFPLKSHYGIRLFGVRRIWPRQEWMGC